MEIFRDLVFVAAAFRRTRHDNGWGRGRRGHAGIVFGKVMQHHAS